MNTVEGKLRSKADLAAIEASSHKGGLRRGPPFARLAVRRAFFAHAVTLITAAPPGVTPAGEAFSFSLGLCGASLRRPRTLPGWAGPRGRLRWPQPSGVRRRIGTPNPAA